MTYIQLLHIAEPKMYICQGNAKSEFIVVRIVLGSLSLGIKRSHDLTVSMRGSVEFPALIVQLQ